MSKIKKDQTFLLLLQIGRHQVVQKHDELGVHGDADVVGELGHHAALHLRFAAGVWIKAKLFDLKEKI